MLLNNKRTRYYILVLKKSLGQIIMITLAYHCVFLLDSSDITFVLVGVLQIISGCIMGIYLRKKYRLIIMSNEDMRKNIIFLVFIAIIMTMIVLYEPSVLGEWYMNIKCLVYHLTKIDRIFTPFDMLSVLSCLLIEYIRNPVRK